MRTHRSPASPRRHLLVAALPLIAVLALFAASCGDDGASSPSTSRAQRSSTTQAAGKTTSTTTASRTSVRAYFIRSEKVGPVRRPGTGTDTARAAMTELLAGPTGWESAAGLTTAIPRGTLLEGISVDGAVATVDLSGEFVSGGGSLSMQERVAQVVYTLTQFPAITGVLFKIDGKPVTTIGGEGLMVDTPQTRAVWEPMTPAILVESPMPGDTLTSPLRLTGTANTFEATFQVELSATDNTTLGTDAPLSTVPGDVLAATYVTATSGTGTRGTFETEVPFSKSTHTAGTLTVYEVSAKDGSRINVVSMPVSL